MQRSETARNWTPPFGKDRHTGGAGRCRRRVLLWLARRQGRRLVRLAQCGSKPHDRKTAASLNADQSRTTARQQQTAGPCWWCARNAFSTRSYSYGTEYVPGTYVHDRCQYVCVQKIQDVLETHQGNNCHAISYYMYHISDSCITYFTLYRPIYLVYHLI